ncbi:MAG: crossover junction endodeoxyribonuclease [Nitrospira sp.]|nr:crossover junction endodeoxyribonuclease [Nitrospira sp.]
MLYIGIDIGLSGAIGVINGLGNFVAVHDLPVMANGGGMKAVKNQINAAELARILSPYRGAKILVEDVAAMPSDGRASIFSFGDSYGQVKGVLGTLDWPYALEKPNIWKPAMKLKNKKDKEFSRAAAIRAWPDAPLGRKKDHNRAEALLLAKYLLIMDPPVSRSVPRQIPSPPKTTGSHQPLPQTPELSTHPQP